jgi:hypothetical protein
VLVRSIFGKGFLSKPPPFSTTTRKGGKGALSWFGFSSFLVLVIHSIDLGVYSLIIEFEIYCILEFTVYRQELGTKARPREREPIKR